jgi:hypothetical protein
VGGHKRHDGGEVLVVGLVTIVMANLEPMRTFSQEVLQIEPQVYRGHYVEFALRADTLALCTSPSVGPSGSLPYKARRITVC